MVQVVHLGIRKTGTSTFQRAVHNAYKDGVDVLHGKKPLKQWGTANSFNKDDDAVDFASLKEILQQGRGRHAIFSYENLVMYNPQLLAATIKEALPDAKILLTVRSPDSFLASQYKHHVLNGGTDVSSVFSERYCRQTLFKTLNIKRILNPFVQAALKEQFTILPYEWQRDDYPGYLEFLCEFCALDLKKYQPSYVVNKSPGSRFNELVRRVNALVNEHSPDLLEAYEYKMLVRMASMSKAEATALEPVFSAYFERLNIEHELPCVPEKFRAKFAEQMNPLRRMEHFQPYLSEYGLTPIDAH